MNFQQKISQSQDVTIDGEAFENAKCLSNDYPQKALIKNCTFKGDASLSFDSGDILFSECEFDDLNYVYFEFKKSGKVRFENCKINSDLKFLKTDSATILNCTITGSLEFSENRFKNVEISNTKSDSKIGKIIFWDAPVDQETVIRLINLQVGELRFRSSCPQKIHVIGGDYDKIILDYGQGLKDLIIVGDEYKLVNIKIQSLSMCFYYFEGSTRIKDASIGTWNLSQFLLKEGSFKLFNVDFSNEVRMIGSELKGLQFNELDFRKSKMCFDWCVFDGVRFTNVSWPGYENFQSIIEDKVQRLGSLTEVFRQLKKVHISDSNNIQALHFYRHEMATYWERVKIDKSETRWNRFLIRVDKWVSDFGQSYVRPFIILLAFTLFAFIGIWTIEYFNHGNSGVCSSTIGNGVVEYLGGLNPIGKVPDYWHNGAKIIIYIMKVVNGFFIYHFIKATRKFGKL